MSCVFRVLRSPRPRADLLVPESGAGDGRTSRDKLIDGQICNAGQPAYVALVTTPAVIARC